VVGVEKCNFNVLEILSKGYLLVLNESMDPSGLEYEVNSH